jgi:CRP/FNR family cyclic AMP-dependent transcriptional regulator
MLYFQPARAYAREADPSPRRDLRMPKTPARVARATIVRVLDEDTDLASAVEPGQLREARLAALAPLVVLGEGDWDPPRTARDPAMDLGLLVLDGLLRRNLEVAGRTFSELRGPEDLLRPWDDADDMASIKGRVTWSALEPTRLAWLDRDFASAAAQWPEITSILLKRAIRRARLLSFQLAVQELRRVHVRVLLLLWHLADRWGHVHPEGVFLDLALTHDLLGHMVGAHRTSVTLALQKLVRHGHLRRDDNGAWILLGGPPEGLRDGTSPVETQGRELGWR